MTEKPITDVGKVFKDKDGAYRIYIGKKIADAAFFENKEKVRVDYYPADKKIVIRKISEL
jgi:hypothetical protein